MLLCESQKDVKDAKKICGRANFMSYQTTESCIFFLNFVHKQDSIAFKDMWDLGTRLL